MAAMLANAMGTPQHRNASLGLASKLMQKVASAGCACRNPGCEDTDDGAQHWNLRNTTCRLASRKTAPLRNHGLRHLTQSPAFSNVGLNTILSLRGVDRAAGDAKPTVAMQRFVRGTPLGWIAIGLAIKIRTTRSRPNAIAQAQTRSRAANTVSTGFASITVIRACSKMYAMVAPNCFKSFSNRAIGLDTACGL
jgi:hypothetical protein